MKTLAAFKYLVIVLLLSSMGCEEIALEKAFTLGNESTFRMNQLYKSADDQYTLKITEITDSRCAEGVVCIWEGEVTVKGEWTVNNVKSNFEIHSVLANQQMQPEGYTVKIVDAKPYPKVGIENKPEDLVVTMLITKN